MNGIMTAWSRTGMTTVLWTALFLSPPGIVRADGDNHLFTLMPPAGSTSAGSQALTSGPGYGTAISSGAAPIRPVPAPLRPIPLSEGQPGSVMNSPPVTVPHTAGMVPGKVYYFDSAGRPIRSPYDRSTTPTRPSPPKFDYSLAPIQPAARPMRSYVARRAVPAESTVKGGAAANRWIRQDTMVSADAISSRQLRAANNDHNGQGSGPRPFVTIENGNARSLAQARTRPPVPKCSNCGKRKTAPMIATSGGNVRR